MNQEESRLHVLLQMHNDGRHEIELRIQQRDSFAIQYIIAVSALFSIGFMDFTFSCVVFLLIPLLSLFYSIQISYSYVIHRRLHKYISENIEPEIASILSMNPYERNNLLWESYCNVSSKENNIKTIGIRESFFKYSTIISSILGPILFFFCSLF